MEVTLRQRDENVSRNERLLEKKKTLAPASKPERRAVLEDISNAKGEPAATPALPPNALTHPEKTEIEFDIDAYDRGKPLAVSEYVKGIYSHLKSVEKEYMAIPDYMSKQSEVTESMRSILVDWLVDVHYKFKLQPETLFLTVNYLDRFLSKKDVQRERLQLVGISAMLLASKYEEIYFPKIKNFISITDNAYTRSEVLKTESLMTNVLGFNFTAPTTYQFLLRYLKLSQETVECQCVAYYFAERTMQEYSLIGFPPSQLAAACLLLATKYIYDEEQWSKVLEKQSGYSMSELLPVSQAIDNCMRKADRTLQAVWRKYTRSARHKASYLVHEKIGDSSDYISIARGE